ncbi:MAG TPA: ATP/GTP-binding protein [Candidatus Thermoplasmatota archaeon]|nr:ATP/GTP-binding protein [Candidatus Thermoplasmatota archaeon]
MSDAETTTYFVGTAGAGKSSLVAAYDRWAKQHGITTLTVNLDPGAESLPYKPDFDIRDRIKLSEVMEEHGLGPNGAQVAAADMIALNLTEIQEEMSAFRAQQVLVDTPGQLELFVFRHAGKHIVESLAPGQSAVAYLLDPFLAKTASGFASQLLLASTTLFRLQCPLVFLLSKADRVEPESLESIRNWAADPEALEDAVLREEPAMSRELAAHVTRLLATMGVENLLIPVSSVDGTGLDDFYSLVQGAIGQGEDATPEYDTFLGADEGEEAN